MKESISELLLKNGWKSHKEASIQEIEMLKKTFGIDLPEDYEELLLKSNGGSLYGFNTPINIYSIKVVIALYMEFDYYTNIPKSLIFGGDGGGKIYTFDLRKDNKPVLIFDQGDTRYDNIIYETESITRMVKDVVQNKIINYK